MRQKDSSCHISLSWMISVSVSYLHILPPTQLPLLLVGLLFSYLISTGRASAVSDFSESHLQSPFAIQKVILDETEGQNRIDELFVPQAVQNLDLLSLTIKDRPRLKSLKGVRVVITVDQSCIHQRGFRLTQHFPLFEHPRLSSRYRAYSFVLRESLTLGALEALADSEPCLIGISSPRTYTISRQFNDPWLSFEKHLTTISFSKGQDLFNSPSHGIIEDVVVGVIDTGIDYLHEDLVEVMWSDSSGNHGYNFVSSSSDPRDDQGHGTHVAGLIGAKGDNSVGVAGVMPTHLKIVALKALDQDGSGDVVDIVNAIYYAADSSNTEGTKIEVINMSLGVAGTDVAIQNGLVEAITQGVTVIVAAGNDGAELTQSNFVSPASYGALYAGVVTVGSVDAKTNSASSFSNWSTTFVELASPGSESSDGGVLSTYPDDQYAYFQGTSMASPIVAGAAALLIGMSKTAGLSITPSTVELTLATSAQTVSSLQSRFRGGALLNIHNMSQVFREILIDSDGGLP